MNNQGGFFASLFDFSFRTFVAERLIPILYIILLILFGIGALFIAISGFTRGPVAGFFTLVIAAPLYFLFLTIYSRVVLEFLIVVFRIADDVRSIATQGRAAPREPLP